MNVFTEKIQKVWDDNKAEFDKKLSDWLKIIKDSEDKVINARKQFHQWDPLMAYISITDAKTAKFSLRFWGQEVGEMIPKKDNVILRLGDQKYFNEPLKKGDYLWKGKDAKQFRSYFKQLANSVDTKLTPKIREHQVESKFIKEMFKGAGKFGVHNLSIKPVVICSKKGSNGIPLQMPLPISGNTGEPKSTNGHIDILSRHKSGRGGRTKLCIWELKQPRTYKKAAAQAYIYAYALLKVIRDSRSGSEWYKVYGFNSVVPKKLEIEAVVAITRDQKENYEREISILKKKASFEIEGDLITLYPAYYEEKHNSIILTNNPFEE